MHVIGESFLQCGPAAKPFARFDGRSSLAILRGWLAHLGVVDAAKYRTHDLRRGHARDMARNGARLHEILAAGDWRSAAFMSYQDRVELECAANLECHLRGHIDESSDEDEEDNGGQVRR